MAIQARATAGRGRPPSSDARDLDLHRAEIEQMWKTTTLRMIMTTMKEKYDNNASEQAYKRKFSKWGLRRHGQRPHEDSARSSLGQEDDNSDACNLTFRPDFVKTLGCQLSGSSMFHNNTPVKISHAMETSIYPADLVVSEQSISMQRSLFPTPSTGPEETPTQHMDELSGRSNVEDIFEPGSHDIGDDWSVVDSAEDMSLDSEQFQANIDALDQAFHGTNIPAWLSEDAYIFALDASMPSPSAPSHLLYDEMSIDGTDTAMLLEPVPLPGLCDRSVHDLDVDLHPVEVLPDGLSAEDLVKLVAENQSSEKWEMTQTWLLRGTIEGVEKVVRFTIQNSPKNLIITMPFLQVSQHRQLVQHLDDDSLRRYVLYILEQPGPFAPKDFIPFAQDIFQDFQPSWENAESTFASFRPSFLKFMCNDSSLKSRFSRATGVAKSAIEERLRTGSAVVNENTQNTDMQSLERFHPLLNGLRNDEVRALWNGRISKSVEKEEKARSTHQDLQNKMVSHDNLGLEPFRLNFMAEFQHISPLTERFGFTVGRTNSRQAPGLVAWEAALDCMRLFGTGAPTITPEQVLSFLCLARAMLRTGKSHGQKFARDPFAEDLKNWVYIIRHYQNASGNAPAGTVRSFCSLLWQAWHVLVDDADFAYSTLEYGNMMRKMTVAGDNFLKSALDNLSIAHPVLRKHPVDYVTTAHDGPRPVDATRATLGFHPSPHEQQTACSCATDVSTSFAPQVASALGFILGIGLFFLHVFNNLPQHPFRLNEVLDVHQFGISGALEETLLESPAHPDFTVWKPILGFK